MSSTALELVYFPPKQFSPRFGDNFFTAQVDNFDHFVPTTCFSAKYVVFIILVSRGRETWEVKRRFSDFERFLLYLKQNYPKTVQPFPTLPPKTCFGVADDHDFLFRRAKDLHVFLTELFTTLHMEKLLKDETVLDFLSLSTYRNVSV
mmetsp:Transcript_9111/g.18720  ORF Transcript_9111/g.18720 Transcript_9111/m.18720 type:complete len:148 (+) Transcript_9111:116-559(+)